MPPKRNKTGTGAAAAATGGGGSASAASAASAAAALGAEGATASQPATMLRALFQLPDGPQRLAFSFLPMRVVGSLLHVSKATRDAVSASICKLEMKLEFTSRPLDVGALARLLGRAGGLERLAIRSELVGSLNMDLRPLVEAIGGGAVGTQLESLRLVGTSRQRRERKVTLLVLGFFRSFFFFPFARSIDRLTACLPAYCCLLKSFFIVYAHKRGVSTAPTALLLAAIYKRRRRPLLCPFNSSAAPHDATTGRPPPLRHHHRHRHQRCGAAGRQAAARRPT